MEEVTAWVATHGWLPMSRSAERGERSMARWLSVRRREAAEGTLAPACSTGLVRVPGWAGNPREAEDEARWHHRLAQLMDFREERLRLAPPPPLRLGA